MTSASTQTSMNSSSTDTLPRILISACLLGQPVRYDGASKPCQADTLARWRAEDRLVVVCPEMAGGLGVPRPPAELVGGAGADVLNGSADVRRGDGVSVRAEFELGARRALELAREHDCKIAILKEKSPSCGSGEVYDGTFTGTLTTGDGVTTALLEQHGIKVFGETQIEDAKAYLERLVDECS